ncbi:MAG: hypothetical protein AB1941_00905 [Gemmatimonadota bacterium]
MPRLATRRRPSAPRRQRAHQQPDVAAAVPAPGDPRSAPVLTLPLLDGVPVVHRIHELNERSLALCRSLLETGIGLGADWFASDRSPTEFVQRTLDRWLQLHGGPEIDRRFSLSARLSHLAIDNGFEKRTGDGGVSDPLYLGVYSYSAAFAELGPTLQRFEAVSPDLASAFYFSFLAIFENWLRTYDHADAFACFEGEKESLEGELECLEAKFEGDEAGSEDDEAYREDLAERMSYLDDPAEVLPGYMHCSPVAPEAALAAHGSALAPDLRSLLQDAADLARLAATAEPDCLPFDSSRYYDGPVLPALLAVYEVGDVIQHYWDEDSQVWPQIGSHPPSSLFIMRADDPTSVRSAFDRLALLCALLVGASRILDRTPQNDSNVKPPDDE